MVGADTNIVRYVIEQFHINWSQLTEFAESNLVVRILFNKFVVGFFE